ncbi:MAG TPA: EscU/YscU/HrcU family type III secretion system export apparatus switch protein [Baekduia sp.]|nr:EscU/YscU/HrcU family type III secretion system export apparatus switch protein [Baekduia sp.]
MPPRKAIALRYDRGSDAAPRVVASGAGEVAERILERAAAAGVPVREDPMLAQALAQLAVEAAVPEDLWAAVAEVLVWAYALDRG